MDTHGSYIHQSPRRHRWDNQTDSPINATEGALRLVADPSPENGIRDRSRIWQNVSIRPPQWHHHKRGLVRYAWVLFV